MCAVGSRCWYLPEGWDKRGGGTSTKDARGKGKGGLCPGVWLLSGVVGGTLRDRKRMSAEERQVKSREVVSLELLDGRQEAAPRPTQPTCALSRYPARNFAGGQVQLTINHTSLGSLTARVSAHQHSKKARRFRSSTLTDDSCNQLAVGLVTHCAGAGFGAILVVTRLRPLKSNGALCFSLAGRE